MLGLLCARPCLSPLFFSQKISLLAHPNFPFSALLIRSSRASPPLPVPSPSTLRPLAVPSPFPSPLTPSSPYFSLRLVSPVISPHTCRRGRQTMIPLRQRARERPFRYRRAAFMIPLRQRVREGRVPLHTLRGARLVASSQTGGTTDTRHQRQIVLHTCATLSDVLAPSVLYCPAPLQVPKSLVIPLLHSPSLARSLPRSLARSLPPTLLLLLPSVSPLHPPFSCRCSRASRSPAPRATPAPSASTSSAPAASETLPLTPPYCTTTSSAKAAYDTPPHTRSLYTRAKRHRSLHKPTRPHALTLPPAAHPTPLSLHHHHPPSSHVCRQASPLHPNYMQSVHPLLPLPCVRSAAANFAPVGRRRPPHCPQSESDATRMDSDGLGRSKG